MNVLVSYSEVTSLLRQLAKSNYWQSIYAYSKEVGGIQLFLNVSEFTSLQLDFLNELSYFHSIYYDIATDDIDERVLDNDIYTDAYMFYKQSKRKKSHKKKEEIPITSYHKSQAQENIVNKNQWVFTKVKGTNS